MKTFPFFGSNNRSWLSLVPLCMLTAILIAACSAPPSIPVSALDALNEYWESLQGSRDSSLTILRAWQGEPLADDPDSFAVPFEVWCVEAQPANSLNQEEEQEPIIWIVMRQSQDSGWTAIPLMAMSAMWPYQACGSPP